MDLEVVSCMFRSLLETESWPNPVLLDVRIFKDKVIHLTIFRYSALSYDSSGQWTRSRKQISSQIEFSGTLV